MSLQLSGRWSRTWTSSALVGFAYLAGWMRQVPTRARDSRFWIVQLLVVAVTAFHYGLEIWGERAVYDIPHQLSTALYIVPILYATLVFGFEGTVLTGLWSIALAMPGMWIWHSFPKAWSTELFQLSVIVALGAVLAWRVEKETEQRRRAEATSMRLALLNEIGALLGRTPEAEETLQGILHRLQEALGLEAVWLCLWPGASEGEPVVLERGVATSHNPGRVSMVLKVDERVVSAGEPVRVDQRTVAVPLSAERRVLGSLGGAVGDGHFLADEDVDLLATAAHQIGVAIDNVRLYRQRQESLRSYTRQVTQAQEEERRRIARELHDESAQDLVAVLAGIQTAEAALPFSPDKAKHTLAGLRPLAKRALEEMRKSILDLRPSALDDLGLAPAIRWYVESKLDPLGVNVHWEESGEPGHLPGVTATALFRIAQEAINNIAKHARAREVWVRLRFTESRIVIEVRDDGQGFDYEELRPSWADTRGLGILGMKERASLVGGTVTIDSRPGHGTTVRIDVPVEPGGQGLEDPLAARR